MQWDDELETLVTRVVEQFGDDALRDALGRAVVEALKHEVPIPASHVPALDGGYIVPPGACVIPPGVFEEAIRAELRQLMRLQ
jgi:hypothetical protein